MAERLLLGDRDAWYEVWPAENRLPPGTVQENSSYLFQLHGSSDSLLADMLIDGVTLEALRSRDPNVACWRWDVGFHAGTTEVELRLPGLGSRYFEVVTDPDLRKLTRTEFDTMVREVLQDTFALFSLSSFRTGIAKGTGAQIPPLARLEFLRSRGEEICESVRRIADQPRRFLRGREETAPYHRIRRITGRELLKSFRSGTILREETEPPRLPEKLKGFLPERVTRRVTRNSFDTPEHRQIKSTLRGWAAWMSTVADVLERKAERVPESDRNLAGAWAYRLRSLSARFNQLCDTTFLRDVPEVAAPIRFSSLFRSDPEYGRFYRLHQDMELGISALFGDFLQMPLARTYDLYELWAFLRLLHAAVAQYGSHRVGLDELFIDRGGGSVSLKAGAVTVEVSEDFLLCFQKQYREFWLEDDGRGSFTRAMRPDVSVEIGGEMRSLIVLDAKYRIGVNLNSALDSIHAYRDALVREAKGGDVRGVVTAAYLLSPHIPALGDDYKHTSMPGRLFHPEYRSTFRFGAVCLRPGMTLEQVQLALRAVVRDAAGGHGD